MEYFQDNETRQKLEMAQQQQEVAAAAKSQKAKAQANNAAAMMSELKNKVGNGGGQRPKDNRKIGKDEMYHGALEDILTGKQHVIMCCY